MFLRRRLTRQLEAAEQRARDAEKAGADLLTKAVKQAAELSIAKMQEENLRKTFAAAGYIYLGPGRTDRDRERAAECGVIVLDDASSYTVTQNGYEVTLTLEFEGANADRAVTAHDARFRQDTA